MVKQDGEEGNSWLRNPLAVWCCQVEVGYERDQIRELIELGYEDVKRVLEGCV